MKEHTILLVDDNAEILDIVETTLAQDYHVLKSLNAEDALQVLAKEKVDLIITDQRMPGIDAVEEFGAYGNFDSQYVNPSLQEEGKDPKPTVAVPAIPLAWPTGAGVSDRHIYVNDTYNRRIVRVDKTWAAEEVCEIK